MPPNSIGAKLLGEVFRGLQAAQITILVDDFLNDPDAVDKMSYTAWCPAGVAPSGLAKRAFVVGRNLAARIYGRRRAKMGRRANGGIVSDRNDIPKPTGERIHLDDSRRVGERLLLGLFVVEYNEHSEGNLARDDAVVPRRLVSR